METVEQIKVRLEAAVPGLEVEVIPNPNSAEQPSLRMGLTHILAAARFLRDDPSLRFDYASNVTGVDWLDQTFQERQRQRVLVDGAEREVEITVQRIRPGYLEAIYHLYSMELGHGPLVIRQRTANRTDQCRLVSLTPIWRGAEFQEREIYDLYGVVFEGHPDLRRILMWEGFQDFPMRKDYVEPDDYEYEPTPHDLVLEKARLHYGHGGRS